MKSNNKYYKSLETDDLKKLSKEDMMQYVIELQNELAEKDQSLQLTAESHSKYKSLFEMSDDALLVIENFTFVDCNSSVLKMLGYKTKEELLNVHPSKLSPEYQPDGKLSYEKAQEMMELALKKGSHHFEWIHTRANGENFPVEVWLSKVEFDNRTIINTIWRDLTEKKKAEALILKNIKEKEVMLKEIHHRVKNNLQIITSLLNLQVNLTDDNFSKNVLTQSKTRIQSMCKVHEMLYKSGDFANINYKKYLTELLDQLVNNYSAQNQQVDLKINVENLLFNINTAVPLGLVVNELVTNSLKYAFPNNTKGAIFLDIKKVNENKLQLIYYDTGVGYNPAISFDNATSLGLQLIAALTEQLNGEIQRDLSKKGTYYLLSFEMI